MKRSIITIDQETCNGCGMCIPNCPEGAIQLIDGKARLVSDLMCDGLGACLGECPLEAITIVEREAEPYDELKVIAGIAKQGTVTVRAHLQHLKQHNQLEYWQQAMDYLKDNNISDSEPAPINLNAGQRSGCPGSRTMSIEKPDDSNSQTTAGQPAQLTHWPVQMHLISPLAPHYQKSDLLLAADCVAYSLGNFHSAFLKGKTLAIACPKLDSQQNVYIEKLCELIDTAQINSLTVMIMQVPCCRGLLQLTLEAASKARRKVPITCVTVGLTGAIVNEDYV